MHRPCALPVVLVAVAGCASLPPFLLSSRDETTAGLIAGLAEERRVPSARAGSQYALACPGIDRAVALGPAAVAPLRRALEDRNATVRRNAAIALARLGSNDARRPLLEMLARRPASETGQVERGLSVLEAIAVIDAFDRLPNVREDAEVQRALAAAAEGNPALDGAVAIELGELGSSAAADFLIHLLTGRPADPDARSAAAGSLGRLAFAQTPADPARGLAAAALIAAAKDPHPPVRAAAATSLAAIGDRQAAPAVEALLADESLPVQRAALAAVGRLGGPECVGRVLVFLDHRLASVRQEAVAALGALGSVIGLEHALLNDQWRIRRQAVEALAALGTDEALKALRRAVDDQSLPVRQAAVGALAESRRFAAAPLLLLALEDESPGVRSAAHQGLCAIAGQTQPYDYTAPEAVRREGIRAWERWWLTASPPPPEESPEDVKRREEELDRQIAAAIADLANPDPLAARQAEHRLVGFGPRALAALEATFDPAARAFPEAVGDRILPAIDEGYRHVRALAAGDDRQRREAALALAQLDRQGRLTPIMAQALVPLAARERDAFTRRFLLDLVAAHAAESAVPLIAAGLESDDPWERLKSARLLGQRRDREAVPALIARLTDRSAMVRRAAAWALGQTGDARAIEPLTRLLDEANVEVRLEAAAALAGFRRQEGIDEVLRNLAHPDWHLRAFAAEKCGEARLWPALAKLGDLLMDDRPAVRDAAAAALGAITNRDFGYRPADPPEKRDAAVRAWRDFISQTNAPGKPGG